MTTVRMKWIGFPIFGLCLLLQGCTILESFSFTGDLQYHIAIDKNPDDKTPPKCTLVLKSAVDDVLSGNNGPMGGNSWTIRDFQIDLERQFHQAVKDLDKDTDCAKKKKDPLSDDSVKWLASYASEATDPDQQLQRFEEYLNSRKLAQQLIQKLPVVAEERAGEVEGFIVSEDPCDRRSQWFGNPGTKDKNTCFTKSPGQLYKILSSTKDLLDRLNDRVKDVRANKDTARNVRFLVLGYEIPWDEDNTLIRYGIRFYFIDKLDLDASANDTPAAKTEYLGYELDYANEATPEPILVHSMKDGKSRLSEKTYEEAIQDAKTPAPELSTANRILYSTGYPIAIAIGVKNAMFEVAKIPFSTVAGILFGRDNPFYYPAQNIRTAINAFQVEGGHLPHYHFGTGLLNLLGEIPFVGQVFQFNTGPRYMDWDKAPRPEDAREKIFLSRGIYGGDKWGQDTGLWAAWARAAYPDYDIYSPPYRHGTITDVLWSMLNLSHGPGYSEAAYIMRHAGPTDRLYLSGHSGGVQRSASASRILANHGYSVQKVFGIAGPNVGQAYVDERFPNAFRIFLNTDDGGTQDVVSKIGAGAGLYAKALDTFIIGPPKYLVGGIAGMFNDYAQNNIYKCFDRLGSQNATISQLRGKVSALHQTPFRQSLAEPIVFDAYVRSEFSTAFRQDLERPRAEECLISNRVFWALPEKNEPRSLEKQGEGAIPWQRLGH